MLRLIYLFIFLNAIPSMSQTDQIRWSEFLPLPDKSGFAGMYAGVTSGTLVAMGGANFPDRYPWEGGKKKWYDRIYVLPEGGQWHLSGQKLPLPSGYGVSVSYQDKVIIAGGCTDMHHLTSVYSYRWEGGRLQKESLPDLPQPLAYMTGALLGDALILLGGSENPGGPPLKLALLLDLLKPESGWQKIEPWPGPERILPVSGVWNGRLFLMSGENSPVNSFGEKYRDILTDNYALTVHKEGEQWEARWKKLSPIPRGVAAGGTLPLLNGNRFIIWGGVDAVTAQYRKPETHPGITRSVLCYYPGNDTWEYLGDQDKYPSLVTLPVVPYQDGWLYINGEVKPGIRTPSIIRISD